MEEKHYKVIRMRNGERLTRNEKFISNWQSSENATVPGLIDLVSPLVMIHLL